MPDLGQIKQGNRKRDGREQLIRVGTSTAAIVKKFPWCEAAHMCWGEVEQDQRLELL